jgi:predicted helicase
VERHLKDTKRNDPKYVVRLIGQVTMVSLETVEIVKTLSPIK